MIKILDDKIQESIILDCIKEAERSDNYSVLHGAGDGSFGFKYNWLFYHSDKHINIQNTSINKLWFEVQKYLPNKIRLHRGYINAHTYGVEDSIHQDDPDIKKGLTVIAYLCNDWYPEWFGQTIFFNTTDRHYNEIVQSVLPRYNRIIIFDKNLPHCVSPLSRRFSGIRLTCMFKVELLDEST